MFQTYICPQSFIALALINILRVMEVRQDNLPQPKPTPLLVEEAQKIPGLIMFS